MPFAGIFYLRFHIGVWALLLLSLLGSSYLFSWNRATDCQSYSAELKLEFVGNFSCFNRGIFSRQFIIRSTPPSEGSANELIFNFTNDGNGRVLSLDAQSLGSDNYFFITTRNGDPVLASSNNIGTDWSANGRSRLEALIEPSVNRLELIHPIGKGPIEIFALSLLLAKSPVVTSSGHTEKSSQVDTHFFLSIAFALAIFTWLMVFLKLGDRSEYSFFLLLSAFVLLFIFCGLPYLSNVGSIDIADDRSYAHWAYNLGYKLNPFLMTTDIPSWTKGSNIHAWGAGLLLAPFVFPLRLFGSELPMTSFHIFMMSIGSVMLCLSSVVIFFKAFSYLFSKRIAVFTALLTVSTTSLIKWTFARNVFTHTSEAFTLALMTLFLIRIYSLRKTKVADYFGFFIAIFLAVQVRRENVLFGLVPIYYEFLYRTDNKKAFKHIAGYLLAVVSSLIALRATNFFAGVNSFFIEPTGFLLNFGEFGSFFRKNFVNVVFGYEKGIFNLYSIPPIVACMAPFIGRIRLKTYLPLIVVVLGYLTMCIIHKYPDGVEWQNRFLLKLNPIVFVAIGYVLFSLKQRWSKVLVAVVLSVSVCLEISSYLANLSPNFVYYRDFLADSEILFPRRFTANKGLIYLFLPVFLAAVVFVSGVFLVRRGGVKKQ